MNLSDCICFKVTRLEEQLGLDEAIDFYRNQIEDGSIEQEHFERLAALLRFQHRHKEEIGALQMAVAAYENLVFTEHLHSALPVLNRFTLQLKQARSQSPEDRNSPAADRPGKKSRRPARMAT
ncbi:MAG: hypothetical protein JW828_09985 [Sedimentisphaerales bacterium]|nr:hypothetical protein [Sedimentisphaerales bacterium]